MNEKFLELYQQIEQEIKENYPEIISPGQNVVTSLATLDQFKSREDLIFALRNIRNTLAHAKQIGGQDIITVNSCFISFAETILKELKEPRIVEYDKKYKTVTLDSTIEDLTKVIKIKKYAPVVDAKKQVLGILTPDEFFNILCSKKYAIDAKIKDFKKYISVEEYVFVPAEICQNDILKIIEENRIVGKPVRGLIVTDSGNKSGKFISFIKLL